MEVLIVCLIATNLVTLFFFEKMRTKVQDLEDFTTKQGQEALTLYKENVKLKDQLKVKITPKKEETVRLENNSPKKENKSNNKQNKNNKK
jgi:hypothetical protein